MPCQYTFYQGSLTPAANRVSIDKVDGAVTGQRFGRPALPAPPIDRRFEEIFMRGVVMHGPGDVRVEERERPDRVNGRDHPRPRVRICGSDRAGRGIGRRTARPDGS
jgi:hypothetical protein